MKLASLVISVDLAKKLHDLNIKLISCFYWYQEKVSSELELFKSDMTQFMMPWKLSIGRPSNELHNIHKEYPAYCTSEVGEILPVTLITNSLNYQLTYRYTGKQWVYRYIKSSSGFEPAFELISVSASTEQDARARLLIDIIEKGYISISDTIIK
jgi:hypothetical protein